VPNGLKVRLYNLEYFQGRKADFTASVSCLEKVNFQMLMKFGIHIVEEKDNDIDDLE
jgi:hypothetical protein